MCVYAVLSSRPRTVYDNNTLYIEQLYIYIYIITLAYCTRWYSIWFARINFFPTAEQRVCAVKSRIYAANILLLVRSAVALFTVRKVFRNNVYDIIQLLFVVRTQAN